MKEMSFPHIDGVHTVDVPTGDRPKSLVVTLSSLSVGESPSLLTASSSPDRNKKHTPATIHPNTASATVATSQLLRLLSPVLLLVCVFSVVKCDSEEDTLLQGINTYRASQNLTALTKNDNADCLAGELADQFKNQPCTNTTGVNTIPGTESPFPNFLTLLGKCHLNVTNTRDGQIMPACVPNLVPSVVLSNYTQSALYSENLNDPKYTGIGVGSENDWIVVILTTNTPEGGYSPASSDNAASLSFRVPANLKLFFLLVGFLFFL